MKNQGAGIEDLTDIFVKQVRSILEYGAPVWNSSLIKQEVFEIERVQKVFLHMVLGREYESYEIALQKTDLENLADRRETLCRNFAIKTQKNPKYSHWFVQNQKRVNTRSVLKFKAPYFKHDRYRKSPIVYLTNLLNS